MRKMVGRETLPRFALVCVVAAATATTSGASLTTASERTQISAGGCTVASTTQLVHVFVANFNRGRVEAAARLWAPAPRFQWYSTTQPGRRLGSRSKDRSTLVAYFRSRARLHEKMRLTKFAAGYDPKRNEVNFGGKLIRSADDAPRPPKERDFKGAADCISGRPSLIVWSTA
jgi:hypothetical protein